jgi:hypothetical protein
MKLTNCEREEMTPLETHTKDVKKTLNECDGASFFFFEKRVIFVNLCYRLSAVA